MPGVAILSVMKKSIINLTFVILPALMLQGCDKWLELEPEDGIVREEFWESKEQVEAAVMGCYASLQDGAPEFLFLWGEIRADMLVANVGVREPELEIMTGNLLPTNYLANWADIYRSINLCNTVIELAPQVLEKDATLTEAQLKAYQAEALALRGLLYFYLVRTFGEVPLKLDATLNDEQEFAIPKNSQDEILEQILADLQEAEAGAVSDYGRQADNKGRITRAAVWAIQADVYLWIEEYQQCVQACDKIIAAGQHGLVEGNNAWFATLYGTGNSNEGIFELQFDRQKLNPFYPMFSATVGRRFLVDLVRMEELFGTDRDNPENQDIRGDRGSYRAGNSTVWKYLGLNRDNTREQDQSFANWIFYRYAEILLFKAEALAQLGRGAEALGLVEQVRERAGAVGVTGRNPDPSNTQEIADYILEERNREFAYEGKRWFDILRNARRNGYERIDLVINMVIRYAPPDRQQSIANKYRDVNSHYFPIYAGELETNRELEQNPFYKQ